MAPVIGIDLGTTNTVVAVVRDGQASAIADETGNTLIPSVVSFHPSGTVLVGQSAKPRRGVDAAHTIYSIKRLIGRSWDSEEVRQARSRFPFEMREGPGQAALVVARGESYTLPEISAFVLRKARSVAEAFLGTSVERAVITVPANFNDLQRAATKVAGRVAGLEVLRILNEPTAAALAYGFGKSSSERLAVYDFGGGTFDITLLDLSDNVFEVLATAGNTFLGGDDIDLALADRMASEFLVHHRQDLRENPLAFERLRAAAENIKQTLSFESEANVELPEIAIGPGGKARNLSFSITRAEFERLAGPIIDRTFDVCREALSIARANTAEFDQVLLVGGSTRVPLVQRRVEEFFGRPVMANLSPDEVVAIGAAIQANALTGAERRRGTVPLPPAAARRVPTIAGPGPGASSATLRTRTDTIPGVAMPGAPAPQIAPPSRVPAGLLPGAASPRGNPRIPPPNAEDEARLARQSVADILPIVDSSWSGAATPNPTPAAAPREESVAFALSDDEIEDIVGPAPPPLAHDARTSAVALYGDDEITKRGQTVDLTEEEPTRSGRAPASTLALAAGAAAGAPGTFAPVPPPAAWSPPAPPAPAPPWAPPKHSPAWAHPAPPPVPAEISPRPAAPATHSANLAGPSSRPPSSASTWELPSPSVPPPRPLESRPPPPAPPLLVDVTPLTLCVETVRGFCDTVIARNTPVPCEQTREFVTAMDGQTVVRVRVAQGESRRFDENTLLGEVELSAITPAPRGSVKIAVTFALDTSGMLEVSAREMPHGRVTLASLRLVGLPEARDLAHMTEKHLSQMTA
ncbi:MAG TPA: Hsp70 family protein [Polyangiaceae bacterium]